MHLKQCNHIVSTWGFDRIVQKKATGAHSFTGSQFIAYMLAPNHKVVYVYPLFLSSFGHSMSFPESKPGPWMFFLRARSFFFCIHFIPLHLYTHLCIIHSATGKNIPKGWTMYISRPGKYKRRAALHYHEHKNPNFTMQWNTTFCWVQLSDYT